MLRESASEQSLEAERVLWPENGEVWECLGICVRLAWLKITVAITEIRCFQPSDVETLGEGLDVLVEDLVLLGGSLVSAEQADAFAEVLAVWDLVVVVVVLFLEGMLSGAGGTSWR